MKPIPMLIVLGSIASGIVLFVLLLILCGCRPDPVLVEDNTITATAKPAMKPPDPAQRIKVHNIYTPGMSPQVTFIEDTVTSNVWVFIGQYSVAQGGFLTESNRFPSRP